MRDAPATADGVVMGAVNQPVLRWIDESGNARQRTVDCPATIGRHSGNLVSLRGDREVSRFHARVEPSSAALGVAGAVEYTLTDLESSNGTLLNGRRIAPQTPVVLHNGDRITLGKTSLSFEQCTPVDNTAPAATPALDGPSTPSLPRPIVGWLTLPGGDRRLLGSETRIGRSAKNDIVLDQDSQVSRSHAHIRHINDRYILSDLGSANGLRVNGDPVLTPRELRDGDDIGLGNTILRFTLAPLSGAFGESGLIASAEIDRPVASNTSLFEVLGSGGVAPRGDLREVTTLFADMRGSTALSEKLNNPEQTTVIINRIFEALTAEIVRYDGWVVKFAGDNIMAIFGAPRAHEDDSERCVKAALAMLRALDEINKPLKPQLGLIIEVRIGIATGQVVYGEIGGGQFRRLDVMGPSVNLAARLEHASRVGKITVSEATYACAKRSFVFTPLQPMELKGIVGPVQAYEVVRERGATEVMEAAATTDYLIGREVELARMRATLAEVRGGQGRLLGIVGDAGIGKTQLLAAFRRAEDLADGDWIVTRAISYESAASHALLGNVIRALLGLGDQESVAPAALMAALNAALPDSGENTRAEYLALAGELLGVSVNREAITGLDARLRRKLLMGLTRALVLRRVFPGGRDQAALARPLTIALEEMQWADGASVEALDDLIDAIPNVPLLLILTYRPEWGHTWGARSFYRQINLAELTSAQSRTFLRRLLGGAILDDAVAERIIAQCGNNPLLLEETVKVLRARGILVGARDSEGERWTLTGDLSAMNMSSTLVGMLMARLDRLGDQDRGVLQRAAVIGRTFTYRLLVLLTGLDDALEESLGRLKEAEFIVENPLAAEPEYHFKQAIMQEIAYNNILAVDRRVLHGEVGEALERTSGDQVDDQLETLAYHYSRSSNRRKAVEYLLRSGERARRLFANATAIAQFEEALDKLRGLSPQELAQDPTLALRPHESLGDTYLAQADFARAQECYEAGLAMTAPAADRARLWQKLGRVWEARGEGRKALVSYEQGLVLLGGVPDGTQVPTPKAGPNLPELSSLLASTARAHVMLGAYEQAAAIARTTLEATPPRPFDQTDALERRTQADAHHVLGITAYAAGRIDEAIAQHLRALALRQEAGDTAGMQESYHEVGALYWSRGQIERAFEHMVGVTTMLRLGFGDTDADLLTRRRESGPLNANTPLPPMDDADGELAPVERYYRSGLATAQQLGDRWEMALIGYRIGDLLFRQGEYGRALSYLRKAQDEAERLGAREVAAGASIAIGSILAAQGDPSGLQFLERGVAMAEAVESALTLTEGQLRLADARLELGDIDGATRDEHVGFRLATRLGYQLALGLAHRTMGRSATLRRDWVMADRHFRLAVEFYGGVDAQHEIGRTLADFARLRRAWSAAGNGPLSDDATVMLQQAAQIFSRLDMRADLRAVSAFLAR